MNDCRARFGTAVALGLLGVATSLLAATPSRAAGAVTLRLDLEPQATLKAGLPYFPVRVPLTGTRPAGVTREPAYRGVPKYGALHLGDGPRSVAVALDEPKDGEPKIYVDVNGNGDLTDDGDGAWTAKRTQGRVMYGLNHYLLDVSWKTAGGAASGKYGVAMYRFPEQDLLIMFREGARVGKIALAGKEHRAMLVENDADAMFSKPVASAAEAKKSRPVWLVVDLDDNGKFDLPDELYDIRGPFELAGTTYQATVAADGSSLELATTDKPDLGLVARPLKHGIPAPDFQAEGREGPVRLSQIKGKIVILDFWATWCGPCQASMPHLQKVYQSVRSQGVVTLGLCVWDRKPAYDKWLTEHAKDYSFTFAFDPKGQADDNIAAQLYKVTGIPTTCIIDREGNLVETVRGFRPGDTQIEAALRKLGLKVEEGKAAGATPGGSPVAAR